MSDITNYDNCASPTPGFGVRVTPRPRKHIKDTKAITGYLVGLAIGCVYGAMHLAEADRALADLRRQRDLSQRVCNDYGNDLAAMTKRWRDAVQVNDQLHATNLALLGNLNEQERRIDTAKESGE